MYLVFILIANFITQIVTLNVSDSCSKNFERINCESFSKFCVPVLEDDNYNGRSGVVATIGGSSYEASLYFTTISALKAGADYLEVFTTKSSVPIIKTYSPDICTVWPYLQDKYLPKIKRKIKTMDLVVLGPGITRNEEPNLYSLIHDIINICRDFKKPLVLDAGALHAVSKNLSIISNYPSPGVILTPNYREADVLEKSVRAESNITNWYDYWGEYVSVLVKGKEDKFYSSVRVFEWNINTGGSVRRGVGQGDILSGILGTFYNWAVKSSICLNRHSVQYAQSLAAFAAATLTRESNYLAFNKFGRSMQASDMVNEIHTAFDVLMIRPTTTTQ